MTIKMIAVSLSVLALTACATKPEVIPMADKPVVQAPPPVAKAPAPLPPVVQAPPVADPTPYTGPVPGSIDDFAYRAGEVVRDVLSRW